MQRNEGGNKYQDHALGYDGEAVVIEGGRCQPAACVWMSFIIAGFDSNIDHSLFPRPNKLLEIVVCYGLGMEWVPPFRKGRDRERLDSKQKLYSLSGFDSKTRYVNSRDDAVLIAEVSWISQHSTSSLMK